MLDLEEAATRLARVRGVMAALDLDLLLAVDLSRDEILRGNQRWLTGYIPIGGPAAALLGRDGPIELISDRIGKPVTEYYRSQAIPIEPVSGFSPGLLAERVLRRSPRRLGIMEPDAPADDACSRLVQSSAGARPGRRLHGHRAPAPTEKRKRARTDPQELRDSGLGLGACAGHPPGRPTQLRGDRRCRAPDAPARRGRRVQPPPAAAVPGATDAVAGEHRTDRYRYPLPAGGVAAIPGLLRAVDDPGDQPGG